MPKLPPPPVIEGTLKEPIYAMSFGILVSVWSMNIGRWLTPHYFAYIWCTVVAFECFLWFMEKPKQDYEVYRPPMESKRQEKAASSPSGHASTDNKGGKATDEGTRTKKSLGSPQDEGNEGNAVKSGKESKFRFRQKKNVSSPESPVQ